MKSILFASMHKKDDKMAWSGTNYQMYYNLSKIYNVEYIYVHSTIALIFRKIFRLLHNEYIAELLFTFFVSKKFDFLIKKYYEEYVVCICASEFLAYSNTNKKIIYIFIMIKM